MKKIFFILLIFFSCVSYSHAIDVTCPVVSEAFPTQEGFINKITGMNIASRKIAEIIIENELNEELNSKFQANLEIFNIKRLKLGEFKTLRLKSDRVEYKTFSVSDFSAETICDYNKVIYKKTRVYYPDELPMKFTAVITNDDIQNALNSEEFKKGLEKHPIKLNGKPFIKIYNPSVEIKHGRLYFVAPSKTPFFSLKFRFNSDIAVKDNVVTLSDISVSSVDKLINPNIFKALTENINPLKYQIGSVNGKYCKVYITNAQISDNIINVEGIFVINKNYTEKYE